MQEELIILVNEKDEEIGLMPKLEAHQKGLLHRAFSILIFNKKGELLIHKRALNKYHSAGLWTNTCCSHPRAGETVLEAAKRRLNEEMGMSCELRFAYKFIYKTDLENKLIEHELDHVFIGEYNQDPKPNKDEVEAFRWLSLQDLRKEINSNPEQFTPWFKIIVNDYLKEFTFTSMNK